MNYKPISIVLTISLLASLGCKQYEISSTTLTNTTIDSTYATDELAESLISTYRDGLDSVMNVVLSQAKNTLTKGSPEGTLGNLCADIVYQSAIEWININQPNYSGKLNFALLNNGGLRAQIDSGKVTTGDMFRLMPFENEIVILELSGHKMTELINYIQVKSLLSGRKGGVPISKEFELTVDSVQLNSVCMLNNKAFDSRQNYFVATSDYLANGGDDMSFFSDPVKTVKTGIKIRDSFIEGVKAIALIEGKLDGRIRYAP
jgi:2',3'-cyclic-nucleotide 2'-phosphodiesterase (5'-nucleotidase family)